MVFNPYKMAVQFYQTALIFPMLMVKMVFIPNSTGPWPRLQKGKKIPVSVCLSSNHIFFLQQVFMEYDTHILYIILFPKITDTFFCNPCNVYSTCSFPKWPSHGIAFCHPVVVPSATDTHDLQACLRETFFV